MGLKPKRVWYAFWLVFEIGLCSAISFERSRRELSIDVAEHRSILKEKFQNTYYPRFSFTPKTGIAFPKTRFCFYCVECILLLISYHFTKQLSDKFLKEVVVWSLANLFAWIKNFPPNKNPPTAKYSSEKSTNCEVLVEKIHQLESTCSDNPPTAKSFF